MDDYLREIQTAIFRKWISNQKRDYYQQYDDRLSAEI